MVDVSWKMLVDYTPKDEMKRLKNPWVIDFVQLFSKKLFIICALSMLKLKFCEIKLETFEDLVVIIIHCDLILQPGVFRDIKRTVVMSMNSDKTINLVCIGDQ